jgi:transposase
MQLLAFLLRHGRSYSTGKHWTQRHRSWLAGQTFPQQVHRIVFQDYGEALWTAQERRDALIEGAVATLHGLIDGVKHPTPKQSEST